MNENVSGNAPVPQPPAQRPSTARYRRPSVTVAKKKPPRPWSSRQYVVKPPKTKALSRSYNQHRSSSQTETEQHWQPPTTSPYMDVPKEFALAKKSKTPIFSWPRTKGGGDYMRLRGQRKAVETDLQKLANRLTRLQNQEQAARVKINETRRQTADLRKARAQKQAADAKRMLLASEVDNEKRIQTQSLRERERLRRKAFKQYQVESNDVKREQAMQMRHRREEDETFRRIAEQRRIQRAQEAKQRVKIRQQQFKQRQEQQKLYDQSRVEEQREIKVYLEKKRQEHAEDELRRMEFEEETMLGRLCHIEQHQRATFSELDDEIHKYRVSSPRKGPEVSTMPGMRPVHAQHAAARDHR